MFMDEFFDNHATEVGVLRRKLQSKAEALLILTRELEQCRIERDQFKLIAEQAQTRSCHKKGSDDQVAREKLAMFNSSMTMTSSNFDHFLELRDQNKLLRYEVQDLKHKLKEAYGDIKVLRSNTTGSCRGTSAKDVTPAHQREELVEQLEQMGVRVSQLEADLRSVLDEKEELITERESYRCKVHRLNYQINTLLKVDSGKVIDVDALVMDNKYLQDQLQQLQVEKELAQQALVKYKNMLERKRSKGVVKLGHNNPTMVVTHKQVQELLQRGTPAHLPNTEATLDDLRSLCLALLEALQDKSLALQHQRKANKILAERIAELELRLGANVPVFPSELLLEGYSSACVDSDLEKILDLHITESALDNSEPIKNECSKVFISDTTTDNCDTNGEDCLPEDIQELVTKALEEIHNEDSKKSYSQEFTVI